MQKNEMRDFIKRKAHEHIPESNEKITWSVHAVRKLRIDGLKKDDVEISLRECEIIEDYSMKGRSLPGCLTLSFSISDPIHTVIAIDTARDRIFIVTVYKPSSARWHNDWKTRRHL